MTDSKEAVEERLEAEPEVFLFAAKKGPDFSFAYDYDAQSATAEDIVLTLAYQLWKMSESADVDIWMLVEDAVEMTKVMKTADHTEWRGEFDG